MKRLFRVLATTMILVLVVAAVAVEIIMVDVAVAGVVTRITRRGFRDN